MRPERRDAIAARLRDGSLEAGPWYVLADELHPLRRIARAQPARGARGAPLARRNVAERAVLAGCVRTSRHAPRDRCRLRACRSSCSGAATAARRIRAATSRAGVAADGSSRDALSSLAERLRARRRRSRSMPTSARERWSAAARGARAARDARRGAVPNGADHHARQAERARAVRALASVAAPVRCARHQPRCLRARGCRRPRRSRTIARSRGRAARLVRLHVGAAGYVRHAERAQAASRARGAIAAAQHGAVGALAERARREWTARALVRAAWSTLLQCQPHDTLCGCSGRRRRARDGRAPRGCGSAGARACARMRSSISSATTPWPRARSRTQWRAFVVVCNPARARARWRGRRRRAGRARPRACGSRLRRRRTALRSARRRPSGRSAAARSPMQRMASERRARARRVADALSVERLRRGDAHARLGAADRRLRHARLRAHRRAPAATLAPPTRYARASSGWRTQRCASRQTSAASSRSTRAMARVTIASLLSIESTRDAGDLYTPSLRGEPRVAEFSNPRLRLRGPLRASLVMQWRVEFHDALRRDDTGRHHRDDHALARCRARAFCASSVAGDNRHHRSSPAPSHRHRRRAAHECTPTLPSVPSCASPLSRRRIPRRRRRAPRRSRATSRSHRHRRGATIYSDGLGEYEIARSTARVALTLLRSVGELSRNDLPERPGHAGWPAKTPEAQEQGAFAAGFALLASRRARRCDDRRDRAHRGRRAPSARRPHRAHAPPICAHEPAARRSRAMGSRSPRSRPAKTEQWLVLRCVNLTEREVGGRVVARRARARGARVAPRRNAGRIQFEFKIIVSRSSPRRARSSPCSCARSARASSPTRRPPCDRAAHRRAACTTSTVRISAMPGASAIHGAEHDELASIRDHVPPARRRRLNAEAEKGQPALEQHRAADAERDRDDRGRERVGEHVLPQHARTATRPSPARSRRTAARAARAPRRARGARRPSIP